MYLLGLSGFRTRRRGTAVFVEALDLDRTADDGWMVLDRSDDPGDSVDSRRRARDRFGVYAIAPVSTVLAVAVDPPRCRREKLTPRFPMPPARAMTGGLLGQCELMSEDF